MPTSPTPLVAPRFAVAPPAHRLYYYEFFVYDFESEKASARGRGDGGRFRISSVIQNGYTAFGQLLEDTTAPLAGLTPPINPNDQTLMWKGRPHQVLGGTEVHDMRARQWVPELGSFLSVDEYALHDARSTLWGWGGQNPIRWSDLSGRLPPEAVHDGQLHRRQH